MEKQQQPKMTNADKKPEDRNDDCIPKLSLTRKAPITLKKSDKSGKGTKQATTSRRV